MRETSSLHPHITTDLCNIETVSICLLNIRSFKKHSLDLSNDPILSKCDVFALTETQLLTSVPNDDINSILNDFFIHRSDHNSDKFLSLAVCYKDTITLCDTEYFTSINGLRFLLKVTPYDENSDSIIFYIFIYLNGPIAECAKHHGSLVTQQNFSTWRLYFSNEGRC